MRHVGHIHSDVGVATEDLAVHPVGQTAEVEPLANINTFEIQDCWNLVNAPHVSRKYGFVDVDFTDLPSRRETEGLLF